MWVLGGLGREHVSPASGQDKDKDKGREARGALAARDGCTGRSPGPAPQQSKGSGM